MLVASRQAKEYQASATVLLNPDASLLNVAGKSAADTQARFDAGQAVIASTPDVASLALGAVPNQRGITPDSLLNLTSVSSDPSSNVLTFTVRNHHPAVAVALVNAYVAAYTRYNEATLTRGVRALIAKETSDIHDLSKRIANLKRAGASTAALHASLNSSLRQRTADQSTLTTISAGGGAQVARRAVTPVQTQPDVGRDAAAGIAFGLVLGVVLALAREALDNRVRSAEEVSEQLGITLLARIPTPPKKFSSQHQLAMIADPDHATAEPYRKLQVALDFANLDVQAKIVMVTSAIEKEGKSTTVANLAVAFAHVGRRVVLVDLDLRRPSLDIFFDLPPGPGITDIVLGKVSAEEVMRPIISPFADHGLFPSGADGDNHSAGVLTVITAGTIPPIPVEFLESQGLHRALDLLATRADILLIDTAPLLPVADSIALASKVDAMILLAHIDLMTQPILQETRRVLATCRADKLGLVLTGAASDTGYAYKYRSYRKERTGEAAPKTSDASISETIRPIASVARTHYERS